MRPASELRPVMALSLQGVLYRVLAASTTLAVARWAASSAPGCATWGPAP